MSKFTRVLALALALALTAAIAACGGSTAATTTTAAATTAAATTAAATTAEATTAAPETTAEATTTAAPETTTTTAATTTAAPETTAAPVERITITTNLGTGELSEEEIAQFEADNPDIHIEIVQLDDAKMAAMLATNSAPDILRVGGAFDTPTQVTKGIWMDITDYIMNSTVIQIDDLLPICNVYRFDGHVQGQGPYYGLPKDWSNDYAMFYNKAAFDKAGVPVPSDTEPLTWPEVMDLARQLTIVGANGETEQYGLSATEWGQTVPNFNFLLQYVVSAGANISSEDNRAMDLDIPEVKDFLTMWINAVKDGIGPNPLNGDQTSGGDLFLAGKSALIIDGFWYQAVIGGNEETKTHVEDFGMLPTPIAPGGTRVAATGSASGIAIYANSPHPDEAFRVMEWYCGGPPADTRAQTGWGMPITASRLSLLPSATAFNQQVSKVMKDETNFQTVFLPVNPYLGGGGWGILDKYVTPLLTGEETVDNVAKLMTEECNQAVQDAIAVLG